MIITHLLPKLIKNSALILCLQLSLVSVSLGKTVQSVMENPSKQKISLRLSRTKEEHTKGLSGMRADQFKTSEGMLFINDSSAPRTFWMPDTYFNLDIIFLDSKMTIVGIEKNVPAHPGDKEPPAIYRTKTYDAQYVLETKTGSPFSKKLKVGDRLKWSELKL